jgi:hypothetical protein
MCSCHSAFILVLLPVLLIISSSVYPSIISGIQNKEIAIIADAVAQLQEKNSRGDSSGYHANIPVSDMPSTSPSPTPTTSAPSSIVSTDTAGNNKDVTTQAAIGSLTARPTNNIVNTNSFYDVVFVTSTAGVIKKIQVTFPLGTTVPTSASFNEAEGIGPGTVSKTGQTLTYTVTNAVNVPAGTKIRLEFSNIVNPQDPSSSYQVIVRTRNVANVVMDGPTLSVAYNIKQIGTDDLENGAITTDKIASGAVTGNKLEGTTKLEFGTCSGFLPPIPPLQFRDIICVSPQGVQSGDQIVVEHSSVTICCPEPVHTNSVVTANGLAFGFINPSDFYFTPSVPVTISYIIFKAQ